MTLRDGIERGAALLSAAPHPERARRDAETLLLHVSGRSRADLLAHSEEELDPKLATHYDSLLTRRAAGEPIQYIVGETEFYGLPFCVAPNVLIPRPETEHLVEKIIGLAASFDAPRIADIGVGSGAIAVALARQLPNAQIIATDISEAALGIAQENARRNQVEDLIRFLQGDLLSPVAGEQFDFIVSNPPYVPASDRDSLAIEVRDYEPALALFAGADGLDIYRRLIPEAFTALKTGGSIAFEIGFGQAASIERLLASAGFATVEFTPDLQGIPRVVTAQRP